VVEVIAGGSPLPFDTYQLTVEYTITIENVGAGSLSLGPYSNTAYGIRDLLPLEFCYLENSALYQGTNLPDPERNIPKGSKPCPVPDTRQQLDWSFADEIPSGETRTLTYRATATAPRGDYWSDLLVNMAQFAGPSIYSWPTAALLVRDMYKATATIDGQSIVTFNISVGTDSGTIQDYVIN
jgi:hypothetical protein